MLQKTVITSDNVILALNHYTTGHRTVLIIAHGWFMSKDSKAFRCISKAFSTKFDVITFDFRGHSKSGGLYTFGAKETEDLKAVVDYAKSYEKIYLIGFSLGALTAINYCAKYQNIDKLIAVSAPVSFAKIENNVFSPNAFVPTFKKFELKRWTSIRFSPVIHKKIAPIDVIKDVNCPILLLAGENDPIISSEHNTKLFKKANFPKDAIVIKGGKHAEDLFLEHEETFMNDCLDWFSQPI